MRNIILWPAVAVVLSGVTGVGMAAGSSRSSAGNLATVSSPVTEILSPPPPDPALPPLPPGKQQSPGDPTVTGTVLAQGIPGFPLDPSSITGYSTTNGILTPDQQAQLDADRTRVVDLVNTGLRVSVGGVVIPDDELVSYIMGAYQRALLKGESEANLVTSTAVVGEGMAVAALNNLLLQAGLDEGLAPSAADLNHAADLQVQYANSDPNAKNEPPLPGGVTPEVYYHSEPVLHAMSLALTRNAKRVQVYETAGIAGDTTAANAVLDAWATTNFATHDVTVVGEDGVTAANLSTYLPQL